MKTLILITFLLLTVAARSQSVLTLETGTTIEVLTGANLCVDVINGPGILYGGGSICGGLVGIEPIVSNAQPTGFSMSQNYPNPFNPVTIVKYQLPKAAYLKIMLFDQLGREAGVLFDGNQQAGYYQVAVDGTNLASGIYYCRITTESYTKVIKMSLIK